MAWVTEIIVLDFATRRVRVTATRTVGEDIEIVSAETTVDLDDLTGSRARVVAALWDAYQAKATAEAAAASLFDGWEDALNTALEAKEK